MIAEASPPPSLGRYQLHKQIGEGGMAEVFLALDTGTLGLDRWVAIKRVHSELALEKKFVDMFLDEARLAARIAHPNVAQVLDLGEAGGVPYLVMEYLRGRSVSDIIARAISLDEKTDLDLMCRIVADACEGAHAAHELRGIDGRALGLVHRDLSPHNIFVTYDGAVKVMDFGIAKAIGRATRTAPGTRKGKFSYMAPEQVRGEDVDRRCDVFALGLVLYEATCGRAAFEGVSDLDQRALGTAVVPPSKHRKSYPKALESIVMRAVQHEPRGRFESARAMGEELEQFLVERRALTNPARIGSLMSRLFPEGQRTIVESSEETPSSRTSPGGEPVQAVLQLARVPLEPPRAQVAPITETRIAPLAPKRAPLNLKVIAAIIIGVTAGAIAGWVALVGGKAEPVKQRATVPPVAVELKAQTSTRTTVAAPAVAVPIPLEPVDVRPPRPKRTRTETRTETRAETKAEGLGSLDVRSDPWANVFIDGRAFDATPLVGLPLTAGTHNVRLVTEDGRAKRLRVKIQPGRPTALDVKF